MHLENLFLSKDHEEVLRIYSRVNLEACSPKELFSYVAFDSEPGFVILFLHYSIATHRHPHLRHDVHLTQGCPFLWFRPGLVIVSYSNPSAGQRI